MYYFPRVAVTTYHKVGGLKLRNLYFDNSREQKSNIKLLEPISSGGSEGESLLVSEGSGNPRCSSACGRCTAPVSASVVCHMAFFPVCPCVFAWSSSKIISSKILFTNKVMFWESERTWNMKEHSLAQYTHLVVPWV